MSERNRTFVVHAPALGGGTTRPRRQVKPREPAGEEEGYEPPLAYFDSARDVLFVGREHRDEVIAFLEEREGDVAGRLEERDDQGDEDEREEEEEKEKDEQEDEDEREGEAGEEDEDEKEIPEEIREWLRRIREWLRRLREGGERDIREWNPERLPRIGDVRIRNRQCVMVEKEWKCVDVETVRPPLYLKAGPLEFGQCVGSREQICWEMYTVVGSGELYEDPGCTVLHAPAGDVAVHDWLCLEV